MITCPECGEGMRMLLLSRFCPNDCDREEKPKESKDKQVLYIPFVVEHDFDLAEDMGGYSMYTFEEVVQSKTWKYILPVARDTEGVFRPRLPHTLPKQTLIDSMKENGR